MFLWTLGKFDKKKQNKNNLQMNALWRPHIALAILLLTKQSKSVQFHALMEEYFIHLDTCDNPLASVTTALQQGCCLTRLIGQIVDL